MLFSLKSPMTLPTHVDKKTEMFFHQTLESEMLYAWAKN